MNGTSTATRSPRIKFPRGLKTTVEFVASMMGAAGRAMISLLGHRRLRLRKVVNDMVFTKPTLAKGLIGHFGPTRRILDPCRGNGAFYDNLRRRGIGAKSRRPRFPCMQ